MDALVEAEPDAIHHELVPERRHQSLLQGQQSVHAADRKERMNHVAIVYGVLTSRHKLALQLHPSLGNLHRIREEARTAGCKPADCELNRHRQLSNHPTRSGCYEWRTQRIIFTLLQRTALSTISTRQNWNKSCPPACHGWPFCWPTSPFTVFTVYILP